MKLRGGAEGIMLEGGRGRVGGSESPIITTRQTQVATLSIENCRPGFTLLHQVCAGLMQGTISPVGEGGTGKKKKKRGKEEKYTKEM
jgi:hypothetical protein